MKDKNYLLIGLITLIIISVNTFWIINYSQPYNSEDMIILANTKDILEKYYQGNLRLKDLYYMQSQPFIPLLMSIGLIIYSTCIALNNTS